MKKTLSNPIVVILTTLLIAIALMFVFVPNSRAQAPHKDSLVVQITMDSLQFKQVIQLIQENIPSNTLTGKMVLNNILTPLYQNAKLVPREAIKPKQVAKVSK